MGEETATNPGRSSYYVLFGFVLCFLFLYGSLTMKMATDYLAPNFANVPKFLTTNASTIIVRSQMQRKEVTGSDVWVYCITPSKSGLMQKAHLTRLSQTLRSVPKLHWVLIEDSPAPSSKVKGVLERSGVSYVHLNASSTASPLKYRGRGMWQRNVGLKYLVKNYKENKLPSNKGVVYMMDDDNTYDLRLFDMMRQVKRIGVWGVGLAVGALEAPKVKDGKVVGYNTGYAPNRKFAIDMAGFAVSLKLVAEKNATFPHTCAAGLFETCFLEQFKVPKNEIQGFEPKERFNGKKEVFVWHTKSKEKTLSKNANNYGYEVKKR